jgi:hypothetical protein
MNMISGSSAGVQILEPVIWMNELGNTVYEIHYFHAQKAHTQ